MFPKILLKLQFRYLSNLNGSFRVHYSLSGFNRLTIQLAVADPGFPRGGGANSAGGGGQHTILPNFPQNCMILKEFGPGGGARPKFYYVDPPLVSYQMINIDFYIFLNDLRCDIKKVNNFRKNCPFTLGQQVMVYASPCSKSIHFWLVHK